MGFTTLLTSQAISVAFFSEHEKSERFCSEALISAWGSFTCHKSTTRDARLYFPSEGSHTRDFYALKNRLIPAGFVPTNLGWSGRYDNHGTSGIYKILKESQIIYNVMSSSMLYQLVYMNCAILFKMKLLCLLFFGILLSRSNETITSRPISGNASGETPATVIERRNRKH